MPLFNVDRVGTKDTAVFFRQFSLLIDMGVPLLECLGILAAAQEKPSFQKILADVRAHMEGGATLANAMRRHPGVFDTFMSSMIAAGEIGGVLDIILRRLATSSATSRRRRAAIHSVLIWPIAVISVVGLTASVLPMWIAPHLAHSFARLGISLPPATRLLIGLSVMVRANGWLFLVGVAGALLAARMMRLHPHGRHFLDSISLRIPIVGNLRRTIAVNRFSRTLEMLIGSGSPLSEALEVAAATSGNAVAEVALLKASVAVAGGRPMVDSLKECPLFPANVIQIVEIGETAGSLEAVLRRLADLYDDEVDGAINDLFTKLSAVVIGGTAIVIVMSVISLGPPLVALIDQLAR
jgi:type IV pilus assembly protein PilC